MVLKTSMICNDSNYEFKEETTQKIVNTIDFKNRDLEEFLTASEEIELNQRQRRSQKRCRSNTMVATMMREEIFESTNLDDDRFLNALEHQNSSDESKMCKTFGSSIEELLEYFGEDVKYNSSAKSTPTKKSAKGKVAMVVANFRNKLTPSPLNKCKKQQLVVKSNIQELRNRYESSMEAENSPSPKSEKQKSQKFSKMSKVKQMVLLFNAKINALLNYNIPQPQTPEPISPGLSSITSPEFTSTLKPKSPKYKPELATFTAKLPSPKPSPLFRKKQLQKSPSLISLFNSPMMKRKQLQKETNTTCLVAESVFSQLSVKDKALLYNKFIADMTKRNPKFSKNAEKLDMKKVQGGEVIYEKQGTVKQIKQFWEPKFIPTKSLSKTLQRLKKSPSEYSLIDTTNTKEYEDILNNYSPCSTPVLDDSQNSSTLIMDLNPIPLVEISASGPETSPYRKNVRFLTELSIKEPCFKRTQEIIKSSLPVEPYAPPKKVRRTRIERLSHKRLFQNQHMENLFYKWLKDKNGVVFNITTANNKEDVIKIVPKNSTDKVIPPKAEDKLLEEAINKLEDRSQQEEENVILLLKETIEDKSIMDKPVIEVELPVEHQIPKKPMLKVENKSIEVGDDDFGLTRLPKTTSEESYTELIINESPKLARKKKLRKNLNLKKDNQLDEMNTKLSTDSDSDCKTQKLKMLSSSTLPKTKTCAKGLMSKATNSSITSENPAWKRFNHELYIPNNSLMRQVNSPSKIKTVYTLTVMTSPSQHSESDLLESPTFPHKEVSKSWPSLLGVGLEENSNLIKDKFVNAQVTDLSKIHLEQDQQKLEVDISIDQGFETGSNDMESPMRLSRKSPNFSSCTNSGGKDKSLVERENPKNFSTPNKNKPVRQKFTAQHKSISPIAATLANKRSSPLVMQAIQEDTALEDSEQSQHTPSSINECDTFFSSEPMTSASNSSLDITHESQESSKFWISVGDFTATFIIRPYKIERLLLMRNIFGQKSLETKEMNFGIDDQMFLLNNSATSDDLIKKIPKIANCSQYWFSCGDVLIPFTGKQVSSKNTQMLFNYMRVLMENPDSLRFGIDNHEFSNSCQQTQTNFLTNLNINWRPQASPLSKCSDLDQSNIESEEIEECSSNPSDTTSIKSYETSKYQNSDSSVRKADALEEIFEDARLLNLSKIQTDQMALKAQFSVPEMLKVVQNQQLKLKSVEDRIFDYAATSCEKYKNINQPTEYMQKLRRIISVIDNVERGIGFTACSVKQLECFMFFLLHYADICLTHSTALIEDIVDVLLMKQLAEMKQQEKV